MFSSKESIFISPLSLSLTKRNGGDPDRFHPQILGALPNPSKRQAFLRNSRLPSRRVPPRIHRLQSRHPLIPPLPQARTLHHRAHDHSLPQQSLRQRRQSLRPIRRNALPGMGALRGSDRQRAFSSKARIFDQRVRRKRRDFNRRRR